MMALADLLRRTLENLDSGEPLSDKIRKGRQGSVLGPLDHDGQKIAMKIFDYTGRPDVARAIQDFEREYQSLKALPHPSIVQFIAFDHIPADNTAYLRMQWASTGLSDGESGGAIDLGDIICHHDGLHSQRRKTFLPETFIWHILFHLSAALSLCHHGVEIQRKRITERTDTQSVLNSLTKNPPSDLHDLAIQHPSITWNTERITFSVKPSHESIIHRDIKPRNVLLNDPPWNDADANWRMNVTMEEGDIFCVYPVVLLGDFGLSAPLQIAQTVGIGSYGFTAPEVPLACRPDSHPFKWTTSCDIFSLGATLWNLMSLQTPPDSLPDCDSLPELPTCYSPQLRNLVLRCYAVNQSSRPEAVEILDECIQRGYWNETLVSPYGTVISSNFHAVLQQSWHDCLEQLNLPRKSTALIKQAPALFDNTLNLMKLGQEEKYGRFSIFIAGAYLLRNFVCNPRFLVPLQRAVHFVGRQRELRLLHSRLNSSTGGQVVISLSGMPGIGKTQMAIQFAHQVKETDPKISVFWVNGANLSAIEESYHRIAVECDIVSNDQLDSLFMSRVKNWLETERAGRWLMIIDNVDNEEEFFKTEDTSYLPASEYVPKCTHGSILYTTRNLEFADLVSVPENIIPLSPFTEAEATSFLSEMISATKPESQLFAMLATELEYHPLAISQATAFMNSYALSISEYMEYLRDQRSAQRLLRFETTDSTRDKGWESLYSTWEISFSHLQRKKPLAADVLALMSFLNPDNIPVSLLAQAFTDKLSLSEAITSMRTLSLVSPHSGGNAYAIQRLVQITTAQWLEFQGSKSRFLSMALRLLAQVFPKDQYDKWELCSVLLPHAMRILSFDGTPENDLLVRAELLERVSQYELKLGMLQNAEGHAREAFQITSKVQGGIARDTSRRQAHLARVLLTLGKYHEADELASQAFMNLQEQDPASSDTINTMGLLGLVVQSLGRYSEAVEIHRMELRLRSPTLESDSIESLFCQANLALALKNLGVYEEAEFHFRVVLSKMERLRGPGHPDTIAAMANLANILRDQGQLDEAARMEKEVLENWRRILGEEHPDTITAMNNLAVTLGDQGKLDKAAKIFEEVLGKMKRIFGNEHPSTISALNNLANTLRDQGQPDKAAKIKREVLEKRRRILGTEHPDTIAAMNNLAITLRDQGSVDEAEIMFKEVLGKMKRILGDEHPSTVSALNNLANTLRDQGQLDEAVHMFKEVLEKMKRILGDEHPSTISAINNLANTLKDQGQLDEAVHMLRKVLGSRQRILGAEHPDTIGAMNNLAVTLRNQGQLDEAIMMEREVVEKRRRILGEEHPDTITAMNNLAVTLRDQGKLDEAAKIFEEALEKMKRFYGEEHPSTISALNNFGINSVTEPAADRQTCSIYYGSQNSGFQAGVILGSISGNIFEGK